MDLGRYKFSDVIIQLKLIPLMIEIKTYLTK